MAFTEEFEGLAQKELILIPIIDCSGSMAGEKIGQVNEAMSEVPEQLKQISEDLVDIGIRIAPMKFSTGAEWFSLENGQPASVESFRWLDINPFGLTDLGAALSLLNEKLTITEKGGWMKGRGGVPPVIVLLSDGQPTDNYQSKLETLKKRGWFRAAHKFAVAIGADANKDILTEFTGYPEAVIEADVVKNHLATIVTVLMVSASSTVSQNSVSNNAPVNQTVVQEDPDADEKAKKEVIDQVVEQVQNATIDNTDGWFPD